MKADTLKLTLIIVRDSFWARLWAWIKRLFGGK
jgi:hypothetical protein